MALINHAKREINAKIVYCGPGLSGKTTNLNYIYKKLKPEYRGKLKVMNIQQERMLFFDFTPTGQGTVGGYDVRFHVYTIIGEASHPSPWKMVLKGVDGVVFVADSGRERMAANLESFNSLCAYLTAYGKALADTPCVIQCNKQDLANAVSPEEMLRTLNSGNAALLPAVAAQGEGVLEALFNVVKMVLKELRESGAELGAEEEAAISPATVMTEEAPPSSQPVMPEEPAGIVAGEPTVDFLGEPELIGNGGVRLPLVVRYGGREKKVAINISITSE
ncbi:MAG: hypothetical protein FD174_1516 [Geobacteraceae bacterium]|nr:MAG: hypothetical protein FD174_1516 [Geobacteraceae bacterium]